MSRRTYPGNAVQTTLASSIVAGSTSIQVTSATGLGASDYLIIDPFNPAVREVMKYGQINGDILSSLSRGLTGSAGGTPQDHDAGAIVISVPTAQLVSDVFSDIEDLEAADANHVAAVDPHPGYILESNHGTSGDPHTQYLKETDFTKGAIDAFGVNAGTLDGIDSTGFSVVGHTHTVGAHTHDGVYSPVAHGHSNATASTDGFMDNGDWIKLDGIAAGATVNQTITAGSGLTGGGSGPSVTLTHETSGQSSITGLTGANVFDGITLNARGHITGLSTRPLTAANIGAATSSHTHTSITTLSVTTLTVTNPIKHPTYGDMLSSDASYTRLKHGANQVVYGNGSGATFMDSLPYGSQAYVAHIVESGASRQFYYFAVASSRRFKDDIVAPSGHDWRWIMGLAQMDFTYKADPTNAPHRFYIAEDLYDVAAAAGADPEVYVERDSEGEIVNVDLKALISDLVEGLKNHEERLAALEAAIS